VQAHSPIASGRQPPGQETRVLLGMLLSASVCHKYLPHHHTRPCSATICLGQPNPVLWGFLVSLHCLLTLYSKEITRVPLAHQHCCGDCCWFQGFCCGCCCGTKCCTAHTHRWSRRPKRCCVCCHAVCLQVRCCCWLLLQHVHCRSSRRALIVDLGRSTLLSTADAKCRRMQHITT
jgi:hypothetical protein